MVVELFIPPPHTFRAGVVADVKVHNVAAIVIVVIFLHQAIELGC